MATAARIKSNSKDDVSTEDIQASLTQVKSDIANLTETLAGYGKSKANVAQKSAANMSTDARIASEKAIADLNKQVEELSAKVGDQVREKPIQSLAIAAGLGVLVSLMLKR